MLRSTPGILETGLYFGARNGDRPHWREAYQYVFEHREPGDLILGMEAPVGEYYLDPGKTDLRQWRQVVYLDKWRTHLADDWSRYPRRTWFVVNREQMQDWPAQDRVRMERTLEDDCIQLERFAISWTPRDLDVFVYLREAP